MSTDKNEFGTQNPDTTSVNYNSSPYPQTLMSDRLPTVTETGGEGSNTNGDGGSHQPSDPDNGNRSVWQIAGKSLVILLVIFGLVWGGRWVWSNYSDDNSTDAEVTEEVVESPEPLPINIGAANNGEVTESTSEPIPEVDVGDDGDIPALGPADPLAMTVGAAILAAALYRFSGLAHQSDRRRS